MSGGDGGAADRGGEARWLRPFPDGEGSDPFLRTFKEAVVPGDWLRALREDVLPVLVLDTTGRDGEETSQRATRVLDGLEGTLVQSGREDGYDGQRLTPYARPAAPGKELPAGEHLVLKAGQELRANVPRKAAKLPYRHLRLMEDLTGGSARTPGVRCRAAGRCATTRTASVPRTPTADSSTTWRGWPRASFTTDPWPG